ncbi:MAG TPA: hypothetical protein VHU62_18305 [Mycobacterium sp.]|jgi:hypothetical protein|nr:hypothetical protein [Mycobacterium sp.]
MTNYSPDGRGVASDIDRDEGAPDDADYRRAGVLIAHRVSANIQGIRSVTVEAIETDRCAQLLGALIEGYEFILSELRTDQSLDMVGELIELATQQHVHPLMRQAANAVVAHHDNDDDRFEQLLLEADTPQKSALLIGSVTDLFNALLPELGTPNGLKNLAEWTARIADREGELDE